MKHYTLVTGASSGIGYELAKLAAAHGDNLILVARDASGLASIQGKLSTPDNDVRAIAIDLAKSSAASEVYQYCKKHKITVATLINNAGFGDYGNLLKSDLNKQVAMIDLNVRTLTELTHYFLPDMTKNKAGKIMNIASIAAFLPGPTMSVYYATKHYVLAFSEAIAEELAGTGVTVTTLCPGPTKTNFANTAKANKSRLFTGNISTAEQVAHYGWRAMHRGKRIVIYGFKSKLLILFLRFLPRAWVTKFVKHVQS